MALIPQDRQKSFAVFEHLRRFLVTPSSWRRHLPTSKYYQGSRIFHSPLSPCHRFYRRVGQSNNDCVCSLFFRALVVAFISYAFVSRLLVVAYHVLVFVVTG